MFRRGIRVLIAGVVVALLIGLWTWARLAGHVQGPPSLMGEVVGAVLPAILVGMGVLLLLAARNHERPERVPQELPTRLRSKEAGEAESASLLFIWASALAFGLSFAFVISLYPNGWSESWVCSDTGDGVSCDLVDGTWYQYALFVLCALVVPVYFLGGPVSGVSAVRGLARLIAVGLPIVEITTAKLRPGAPFDIVALVHGSRRCESFSLRLVCIERASYPSGSSTATDQHVAFVLAVDELRDFVISWRQPLRLRHSCELPATAMHTFNAEHNNINWELHLVLEAPPVRIARTYALELPARLPEEPSA